MRKLVIFLSFLLLIHEESMINLAYGKGEEESFFKKCPPSTCRSGGPEIRFPYRLSSQPSQCGLSGMELSCLGNNTILNHPTAGPCKVKTIDYTHGEITVQLNQTVSLCPVQNFTSLNLTTPLYKPYLTTTMDLVQCPKAQVDQPGSFMSLMYGPIPCLSNSSQEAYFADGTNAISNLPSFCTVLLNNLNMPRANDVNINNGPNALGKGMQVHLNVTLIWSGGEGCKACEVAGKQCSGTKSFCAHQKTNPKVIGGKIASHLLSIFAASAIAFVVLVVVIYFISRKFIMDDYAKHEELLAKYNKKLTRYSFSEIKKITKHFKDKLGQGMELTCSGNNTVLNHPTAGPSKVKIIDYIAGQITVQLNQTVSLCPVQNLTSLNLTTSLYKPFIPEPMALVQCSKAQVSQSRSPSILTYGPIPCLTTSAIAFIVLVVVIYFISRKFFMDDYAKHEELLAKYNKKLTRYNFSEIKKITEHFKDKLGQGGFGSVYKGELPDGILVAIKIIDRSHTDGKDFINEVSTIGTIHHFNVVRLLGFSSEGNRRALVYEFMPSGSLDKYISTKSDSLNVETLLKIVKGVASGPSELYYPEFIYEKLVKKKDLESAIEVALDDDVITKKLLIVAFGAYNGTRPSDQACHESCKCWIKTRQTHNYYVKKFKNFPSKIDLLPLLHQIDLQVSFLPQPFSYSPFQFRLKSPWGAKIPWILLRDITFFNDKDPDAFFIYFYFLNPFHEK
ncbi:hypothetical protein LUZ60_012783 [Juncus effusus]|nr:hypothetical protein LUZ60_012783 [Juncus effusus]